MKKLIYGSLILMFLICFCGCSNYKNEIRKPSGAEEIEIVLYFPDNDGLYLHRQKRVIQRGRGKLEELILTELFKGPDDDTLSQAVYGNVEILSVKTDNGKCTVDLSEEFLKYNTGGSVKETFAIYSIVNSLCELENIDQVKIDIMGKADAQFGGHFVLEEAFFDNSDIVAK